MEENGNNVDWQIDFAIFRAAKFTFSIIGISKTVLTCTGDEQTKYRHTKLHHHVRVHHYHHFGRSHYSCQLPIWIKVFFVLCHMRLSKESSPTSIHIFVEHQERLQKMTASLRLWQYNDVKTVARFAVGLVGRWVGCLTASSSRDSCSARALCNRSQNSRVSTI